MKRGYSEDDDNSSQMSKKTAPSTDDERISDDEDPEFVSCLLTSKELCPVSPSPRIMLARTLSIKELDDSSWLSSSLIDLVVSNFSQAYKSAHFMSIDFF